MKIALVTPYDFPFPGGVTEHILQLDREFRRRGHDSRIIAASSSYSEGLEENVIKVSGAVSSFPFSGSNVRVTISPQVYQRIKKILKSENFDIVHAHEPAAPPLCPIVLHHSRAVNIGTFHAYRETNTAYQITRPILKPLYRKLDGRIFVSQAVRDFTLAQFPGEFRIIPNGIDCQRFGAKNIKPIERFDDGRPNLLYVGRLDKRKGLEYLLTALPLIQREYAEARLLVVGAYDRQDKEPFVRMVRKLGIRHVHFIGLVSRDELPRYYRTATVFCAPSTGFESFGIVLLEAMAAGLPIVASDITGYRQVMTQNREGKLVPPCEPETIARACTTLLDDARLCKRMGATGQHTAKRYDWQHIADAVLAYYDELVFLKRRTASGATFSRWGWQRPSLSATE
jgi:phosphatidylinositol alpha-mannosyltransferase